jgi:hypothetical protein
MRHPEQAGIRGQWTELGQYCETINASVGCSKHSVARTNSSVKRSTTRLWATRSASMINLTHLQVALRWLELAS